MASAWSITLNFRHKDGGSVEVNESYKLEDLVALAHAEKQLRPAAIKAKYVVTWILADIEKARVIPYYERGYVLEKMSIKR